MFRSAASAGQGPGDLPINCNKQRPIICSTHWACLTLTQALPDMPAIIYVPGFEVYHTAICGHVGTRLSFTCTDNLGKDH